MRHSLLISASVVGATFALASVSVAQPLTKAPTAPSKGGPAIVAPKPIPNGALTARPTGLDPAPPPHVAEQRCEKGNCALVRCDRGWADENRRFEDGCEKETPLGIPASRLKVWLTADDANFEQRAGVANLCVSENTACVTKWKNLADPGNDAEQWGHSYFPSRSEFCPRFGQVLRRAPGSSATGTPRLETVRRPTYFELSAAVLLGKPYAIYARVQPLAEKSASYFVGIDAQSCNLVSCQKDSGLHLGWRSPSEFTLDQYEHAVNVAASGGFVRNGPSSTSPMRVVRAMNDGRGLAVSVLASGVTASARSEVPGFLSGQVGEKLYIGRGYKADQGFEGLVCDVAVVVDPKPEDEQLLNRLYGF